MNFIAYKKVLDTLLLCDYIRYDLISPHHKYEIYYLTEKGRTLYNHIKLLCAGEE